MEAFGIASAVYGRREDELKLTTTVVGGADKNEIRIRESKTFPLEQSVVPQIKEVFAEYLATIHRTVAAQREQVRDDINIAVPVVFGWPVTFDAHELIQSIRRGFPNITFRTAPKFGGSAAKSARKRREALQGAVKNPDDHFTFVRQQMGTVTDLLDGYAAMNGIGASIAFHPRGFRDAREELQIAPSGQSLSDTEYKWIQEFERLRERAKTRLAARGLLNRHIETRAVTLLDQLIKYNLEGENRFIMLRDFGDPESPQDRLWSQFLVGEDALRQHFAKCIIGILEYENNICIKCSGDPPSPPFADVAATYVADNLDRMEYGRVCPTAVMVLHD
ncbi:hypothetical protein COV82_01310 [Candidatus Peregrinibacteria bacterium CG11_big_fil_rev_8_21_14_0_20_46_8]|nr:MAG: hypothetical protein COV82_01310 [Candidatus Peregrinibacteria bacterium CG11_big_fil_rev_8_21_14_0_20_46_8]